MKFVILWLAMLAPSAWGYSEDQAARRAFLDRIQVENEAEFDRLLSLPQSVSISRGVLQRLGITPSMLKGWQLPQTPDWVTQTLKWATKRFETPSPALKQVAAIDSERYQKAVAFLAGQTPDPFDIRPQWRLTNRLMGHPANQLNDLEDYLVTYYQKLGLAVTKQPFTFQGRTYHNVVVTLKGKSDEAIVLVDHIDVAARYDVPEGVFKEAVTYGLTAEQTKRIRGSVATGDAVPGADDNASATAALMEAAHFLKGHPLNKTVKLVHLNGEEFPGDCLGARHFAARALAEREAVAAVVVLDMIGVNRRRNGLFQLNTGQHPLSHRLADLAIAASPRVARGYRPVVRLLDDPKSYLYNTDGQIFSAAGFPTLLINEQVNYDEEIERLGYHDEFDRPELMDFPYATALTRVGLTTVLAASSQESWQAAIEQERSRIQAPESLLTHFRVELLHSPLAEDVRHTLQKQASGNPCGFHRSWLVEKVVGDRNRPPGDSVVRRLLNWFPEGRFNRLDELAIADELEFLLCSPEP